MLSTRSLGNCSQSLLALPSRDLKRFVPENFCQEGSMQVINDILQEFSKLAILQKKKEVGIVKCAQKEGFWTIHRVGGSMGENPPLG